jgi:predicted MFS family arabinose efflux permease
MSRLIAGWMTLFAIGTDLFVIAPLLPFLANDFQISLGAAGLSVTSFSVGYVIAAPVFGRLADRAGRHQLLTWCLIAFAVTNLLTSEARDLPMMLVARALCGVAASGVTPSIYALVGAAAPTGRRGTWIGILVTGLLLSLTISAPLAATASQVIGWRAIFRGIAVSGLALALLNHIVWGHIGFKARKAPETPDDFNPAALAHRLVPTVAWSAALYGMYTYLSAGLIAFDYTPGQISRLLAVYGLAAFVGALIGGRLADRWTPETSTRASLLGMATCFAMLHVALTTRAGYFAAAVVLGLTSMLAQTFFPAQQSLLLSKFPSRAATALAWNNSALFLGMTLGSLFGGQAVATGGLEAVLTLSTLAALTGYAVTFSRHVGSNMSRPT